MSTVGTNTKQPKLSMALSSSQQPEESSSIMEPKTHPEDRHTSTMIAQEAAEAIASAGGMPSEDATAVALAGKTEPTQPLQHAHPAIKEEEGDDQRSLESSSSRGRKRYREDGSMVSASSRTLKSHEEQLAARRLEDRERYASMSYKQRQDYNAKRRDQYHRQSEESRQKRRERERNRYHSLSADDTKERNARRAKLERERYQRLSATELEAKNRRRRERAAALRNRSQGGGSVASQSQQSDYTSLAPSVTSNQHHQQQHMPAVVHVEPKQEELGQGVPVSATDENAVLKEVVEAARDAAGVVQI